VLSIAQFLAAGIKNWVPLPAWEVLGEVERQNNNLCKSLTDKHFDKANHPYFTKQKKLQNYQQQNISKRP